MEYQFSNKIASLKPSAIREILKATSDPKVISFAAGNPAPEAFPVEMIRKISDDLLREDPISILQYSVTEGYTPLRDKLKKLCHEHYHVGGEGDDLIVVSGAQQGIDLFSKCICNEGDVVLCEDPSFIGSLNTFRSYHTRLVGVEMNEEGIDLEKLEEAIRSNKNVKYLYVIPNFQNPTGRCMSLARRRGVYELCKKYGVLILEDNPYGDLRFAGEEIPAIKSFDTEGIVVYVGSFSKLLAPGIRVGFVLAPAPIIAKMTVAKQGNDVHTTVWSQRICDRFLETVNLEEHIARIRKIYKHKSALMLDYFDEHLNSAITYTRPQGGLFIWCTLPDGSDMMEFCRNATQHNLALVPGTAFLADTEGTTTSFRVNFSTPTDEQILKGCEILAALSKEI